MRKHTEQSEFPEECRPKTRDQYIRSRARYVQRQHEAAERRQRINPRFVLTDPEVFFNEQNETT